MNLREVIVDLCPHGYMDVEDCLHQHWALAFTYTSAYYHWYTVYLDSTDSPNIYWLEYMLEYLRGSVLPRISTTRGLCDILDALERSARAEDITFTRRAA